MADHDERTVLVRGFQQLFQIADHGQAIARVRAWIGKAEAGAVISLLVGLMFGLPALWSALYGAATAIVPGALMARGATRMADSKSPMATAMSLLGWESAKIVCSVAMLVGAIRVLHPVVWPALLVALAGCLTVYWVALAWRSR